MDELSWRQNQASSPAARKGRAAARGLDAWFCLQHPSSQREMLYPNSALTMITVSTAIRARHKINDLANATYPEIAIG
jgi:hypothetical protein